MVQSGFETPNKTRRERREWLEKGVYSVWDVLNTDRQPYSLQEFEDRYSLRTDLLEYGSFCIDIKEYIGHKDLPLHNPNNPVDSYMNILLSLDQKGVANIYKIMLGKNRNILTETSNKWNEKMNLDLTTSAIGRSFNKISIIDDIYLRYIQFRSLHRRLYTNNILYKIGIKDSETWSL